MGIKFFYQTYRNCTAGWVIVLVIERELGQIMASIHWANVSEPHTSVLN